MSEVDIMSNVDIAIAVVVFILIWVLIAFIASVAIKFGQRAWKLLMKHFEPDE